MNTLIKQSVQGEYAVTEVDIVDEEKIAELENSKLIFSPEFVPLYLKQMREYEFSLSEAMVYGFLRFYLSNNANGTFYFTNQQLGLMFDMSEQTASRCVRKVLECGEFSVEYKIKANGGTFRLIKNDQSDSSKMISVTSQKRLANNNKLKENKLNISKDIGVETPEYGNSDINKFFRKINSFLEVKLPEDNKSRFVVSNMLKLLSKSKTRPWMDEDKWKNAKAWFDQYDETHLQKGFYPQSWHKVSDNLKLWIANKGDLSKLNRN